MYEIDIHERAPETRLYLCKPDRTTIAELKDVMKRQLKLIFGGINQLSFTVPYKVMKHNKSIRNPLIDLIKGDYLVRVERVDYTDYFIISNPQRMREQNGTEYLSVTCHQLQYEWKDKIVRGFSGTKLLYNPHGNEGVLNETLLTKTDWSITGFDAELINKYRTFDETQRNLLEFIYSSIERYGEYIPVVDTINKQVRIQKAIEVGVNRGLSISDGKYLKSLEQTENFDDIVTRLYVYGRQGVSIQSVIPTGMDYIEDFSFYMYGYEEDGSGNVISSSPYMSDGLCGAILNYEELLETKQGEFTNLLDQLSQLRDSLVVRQGELADLQAEMRLLQDQKDGLIAENANLTSINGQIASKATQIGAKQSQINGIESNINSVNNSISTLRQTISIENNFTPEQIKERQRFVKEKVWSDESYINPEDLYEEGKAKLKRMSQPIVSYTVDSVDFLSALNTPFDWDKLRLGEIVTITYPNFGVDIEAKVIEFDYDIDGQSLKLTIANHRDLKTGFLKFQDLLNKATNVSTDVDMSKWKWDLSESNNTDINRIMNSKWDAAKQAVVAGQDENVVVNERGVTLTNFNNSNGILRLLSSTIAMSNDGGNTYKTAITAEGVVAQSLYGTIIAGQNLTIQNTSGSFSVTGQGVTVKDMDLTLTRTDNKSRILMNATDGIKIQSSTNGTSWVDKLFADTDGNLILKGNVEIGSGNSVFKATSQGIQLGHNTFSSAPFRVDILGNVHASSLNMSGGTIKLGNNFEVNAQGVATMTGANISGAIHLGAGSTIQWGSGGANPPTAQQVGALPSNTPIPVVPSYITATKITQTTIESPTINAGIINGVNIYGSNYYLRDGSNRMRLEISTNPANYIPSLVLYDPNGLESGRFTSNYAGRSDLSGGYSGRSALTLSGQGVVLRSAGDINFIPDTSGSLTWNGNIVATRDWVLGNAVARFA